MSTAQILFEQYKVLPKKIQKELKELIIKDEDEMIEVSLPAFKEGLKELKKVLNGESKTTPIEDFLKELRNEKKN